VQVQVQVQVQVLGSGRSSVRHLPAERISAARAVDDRRAIWCSYGLSSCCAVSWSITLVRPSHEGEAVRPRGETFMDPWALAGSPAFT
jgi:hypothetical protein